MNLGHPLAHIPDALLGLGRIHGVSCDVTVATRENTSTPTHTHPTANHVLVTEGVLYLTLDGIERKICAGAWCLVPAGTEHAERFEARTSVIVFWLKDAVMDRAREQ